MKETKKYQMPVLRVIDLKDRLMDKIPLASNEDPLSHDFEYVEEAEGNEIQE